MTEMTALSKQLFWTRRISSWVESFEVNMTWDGGCFLSRLKLPKEFPPSLASSRMERIPIPASEHECRCHLVLSRKDTSWVDCSSWAVLFSMFFTSFTLSSKIILMYILIYFDIFWLGRLKQTSDASNHDVNDVHVKPRIFWAIMSCRPSCMRRPGGPQTYPPGKFKMEPNDHPIEKEHNLPNLSGSMLNFGGATVLETKNYNNCHTTFIDGINASILYVWTPVKALGGKPSRFCGAYGVVNLQRVVNTIFLRIHSSHVKGTLSCSFTSFLLTHLRCGWMCVFALLPFTFAIES